MAIQKNRVSLYIPFIVQTIKIQYRNLVFGPYSLAVTFGASRRALAHS